MDLEIAVVGGGVAGVYSAWRLQQVKTEARMGLFEYSDRIGGRLYTVTLPGLPHVKAELGGIIIDVEGQDGAMEQGWLPADEWSRSQTTTWST